jgi:hypothetical protein
MTINNWIIRIQDGKHFFSYANNGIWAIRNLKSYNNILEKMKPGDNLYFIQNKSSTKKNGLITAYAKFDSYYDRNNKTLNRENIARGWDKHKPLFGGIWNLEIKFTNFVDLRKEKIGEKLSNKLITGISSTNAFAIMPIVEIEKFINDFDVFLNVITQI